MLVTTEFQIHRISCFIDTCLDSLKRLFLYRNARLPLKRQLQFETYTSYFYVIGIGQTYSMMTDLAFTSSYIRNIIK